MTWCYYYYYYLVTSNQVKQRLQEFVLNKQQREAAVAGVPDTKMLKRWLVSRKKNVKSVGYLEQVTTQFSPSGDYLISETTTTLK